jgi:hypothetical protein
MLVATVRTTTFKLLANRLSIDEICGKRKKFRGNKNCVRRL